MIKSGSFKTDLKSIKSMIMDCLLGLEFLKSNNLHHLDIKPENI